MKKDKLDDLEGAMEELLQELIVLPLVLSVPRINRVHEKTRLQDDQGRDVLDLLEESDHLAVVHLPCCDVG